jgi:hypothetical protein
MVARQRAEEGEQRRALVGGQRMGRQATSAPRRWNSTASASAWPLAEQPMCRRQARRDAPRRAAVARAMTGVRRRGFSRSASGWRRRFWRYAAPRMEGGRWTMAPSDDDKKKSKAPQQQPTDKSGKSAEPPSKPQGEPDEMTLGDDKEEPK